MKGGGLLPPETVSKNESGHHLVSALLLLLTVL